MQVITVSMHDLQVMLDRTAEKTAEKILSALPVNLLARHDQEVWLDIDQFCEYHPDKPKKPTVYGWVSTGTIPNHKSGKKLRFLKSEIDAWLMEGKSESLASANSDADEFLSQKRRPATV